MKSINPNGFGEKLLVEQCQKLDISELLKQYRSQLKVSALSTEIMGVPVKLAPSKTRFNGTRYWFSCPLCSTRVRILYQHPLSELVGCRNCLNLDYRKRRFKGMAETLPDMSEA